MQPKVNYTIVGLFVVILGIFLVYSIFWLTAGTSSKHYRTYVAYMNESVSGLTDQAPVKYNGVQVGIVDNISLNPNDPREVKLVLNIDEDIPIHNDVTATLETQGITGIAFIGLRGGSAKAPLLEVQPGQEYPVIPTRPSLFLRLDAALTNLTNNLDNITGGLKNILDEHNQLAIRHSLAHIEEVTEVLARNSSKIDSTVNNLDILVKNTKDASQDFPELVKEAKTSLVSIRKMADNVSTAGNQITMTMQKGNSALDNIANQLSPQFYSTLQDISDLSNQLKGLVEELRNNPSMLIRGKHSNKPGPGE